MVWKLEALTGEHAGKEVTLGEETLIGRHQDCTLVLQSAQVSRRHAALVVQDDGLWLQDLNSSNGTYVNGEKTATHQLHAGDVIRIDQLEFKVIFADQSEAVEVDQPEPHVEVEKSETIQPTYVPPASAHDEGMPSLAERAKDVDVSPQGMPSRVATPKPAPIPEGVDLSRVNSEPAPVPVEVPVSRVEQEKEQQENASIGLISLIVLIILAILAWVLFQ